MIPLLRWFTSFLSTLSKLPKAARKTKKTQITKFKEHKLSKKKKSPVITNGCNTFYNQKGLQRNLRQSWKETQRLVWMGIASIISYKTTECLFSPNEEYAHMLHPVPTSGPKKNCQLCIQLCTNVITNEKIPLSFHLSVVFRRKSCLKYFVMNTPSSSTIWASGPSLRLLKYRKCKTEV